MEQPHDQMRFSVIVPAYNEAAYLGAHWTRCCTRITTANTRSSLSTTTAATIRRLSPPGTACSSDGASTGGLRGPAARG